MSHLANSPRAGERSPSRALLAALAVALALGGLALLGVLAQPGFRTFLASMMDWALGLQESQVTWYITRAGGWTAYLLLWLSTAWGLAMPSKIFDGALQRTFTYDFHEFLSLLALAFTAVHIAVLAFDSYQPFSVAQILLPFLSDYRPVWVTAGALGLYLSLLVTVTFYLRKRIGVKAFRLIHLLSLVAFVAAALHGLFAGSDSSLPAALGLYAVTFLSVVFLTVYWLILNAQQKAALKENKPIQPYPK